MTRSTKRMLNALAEIGKTPEEQYIIAQKHDIKIKYKTVIWFNKRTIKGIRCGAVSLEFGAYNG